MTLEDLADELGVGLIEVKALLRRHFPDDGDFRAPGLTLAPQHIRVARERIGEFHRDRRTRASDLKQEEQKRELPASVSALSSTARRATAAPPREGGAIRLLLHLDLIGYLEDPKAPRGLKESVLRTLREMLVEGRATRRVKSTRGANAGWLRAALGDNGGFHFYLWHALPGQKPTKGLELLRNDVLVRAVRHHDETDRPIGADGLDDYLILTAREYVGELERELDRADPLSADQRRAFSSPSAVTITMGHPGAGKTTVELERARRYEGTVLFATFGRAQAERVRRFTTTFAADGLVVDVRTVEDVLNGLDGRWKAPPGRAASRTLLENALAGAPWGPWRGFPDTLLAELRAHFYGRALPVDFRGQPFVMNRKERAAGYLRRRAEALGPEIAQAAASLAAILAGSPAEAALFGDQLVAHEIAARLHRHGGDAVPPMLRDVAAVFLDEAQDLTVVETLVFVLVVHALAMQRGVRPGFHVAGDEGQTVRATDFDWGELKDLAARLGKPDEHQLPGNLRSPRTLARVVNNSWELYKAFAKTHRPRGYAEAEVFESAVGDVLWVDLSEDPAGFYRALAGVPGAAVVVPDVVVPPDVVQDCARAGLPEPFSAADAKGLDFRVVAVVGLGRMAADFRARAEAASGAIGQIARRLVVDAIRVALSRSTETLILAERVLGPEERMELQRLCSGEGQLLEGVVTRVPVGELAARLDFDEADRTALVTDLLDKFDGTFNDSPERALVFATQAREWLGDSNRSGAVQGRLRERVYEAHGRALLRTAIRASPGEAERAQRFSLANRAFHLAKLPALAQLALDARVVVLNDVLEKSMNEQLRRLVEMLGEGLDGREDAAAALALFAERVQQANPATVQAWTRLLESFDTVALEGVPELDEARREVARRIAATCLLPGASMAAIRLARRAMNHFKPSEELLGLLAEHDGRKADAIGIYRRAGMTGAALRVSRDDGGDPQRSLELARALGDPAALATLERMAVFTSALDALPVAELTKGEREGLLKLVRVRLGA